MECGDVFTASSAESIDEFKGRLSALCGGADWLRHALIQLLLLCRYEGECVKGYNMEIYV